MGCRSLNWDEYFLQFASVASLKSKDPSTKVGCVLVDADNRIVSVGFNGFPRGCSDDPKLYENRDEKYRRVLHAETNAILFSERKAHTAYVTHRPCAQCTAMLIQSGIKRIIYTNDLHRPEWAAQRQTVDDMAWESGTILEKYIPESE